VSLSKKVGPISTGHLLHTQNHFTHKITPAPALFILRPEDAAERDPDVSVSFRCCRSFICIMSQNMVTCSAVDHGEVAGNGGWKRKHVADQ
jgi:hypothetical protein